MTYVYTYDIIIVEGGKNKIRKERRNCLGKEKEKAYQMAGTSNKRHDRLNRRDVTNFI